MTLDELSFAVEELRRIHGGQARVVVPGHPMRALQALEAVTAVKIQPHAYAGAEGLGRRDAETVVAMKIWPPRSRQTPPNTEARASQRYAGVERQPEEATGARKAELEALPHVAVSEVRDHGHLLQRVEDLAMEAGDRLQAARSSGAPDWWQYQDLLDDLRDILDYLRASKGA